MMWINILKSLIGGLMFRIRGGWNIPFTDKNFPLHKIYFGAYFACLACMANGWSWRYWLVIFIATVMATQIAGWGEACGCALGCAKPNPDRTDYLDFDEFCDNFHIKDWKLIDHPQLYGVVWLTLRGVLLTFLIGLALNNLLYMIWGAPMGLIYWFAGWLYRKGLNDGKNGWNTAEWIFGTFLTVGLLCVIY